MYVQSVQTLSDEQAARVQFTDIPTIGVEKITLLCNLSSGNCSEVCFNRSSIYCSCSDEVCGDLRMKSSVFVGYL
jgi:hypothetical protein